MKEQVKQLLRLLRYALPYWEAVIIVVVCSVIYAAFVVSPVLLIKPVADNVLIGVGSEPPSQDTGVVSVAQKKSDTTDWFTRFFKERGWTRMTIMWFVFIVMVVAALVGAAACFGKEYLKDLVLFRTLVDIRQQVGEHLMTLSFGFFSRKRVGELISRITNDIQVTQRALEFIFGDIVEQPLVIVMSVALAFYYCWQLAIITLMCFPIILFPMARLGRRVRKSSRQSLEKLEDVTETLQQMLSGIRMVKAFRLEAQKAGELREANRNFLRKSMKLVKARVLSKTIVELSYGAGVGLLLLVASYMVITSHWDLTMGKVLGFCAAIFSAYKPVKILTKAYTTVQESLAGCKRVFELLDTKPEVTDASDAVEIGRMKEGIEFRNVWFAYDTEMVLKDINLSVKVGEVIAIVGPSGAGKSTLLDLIPRFYDVSGGKILIDGVDTKTMKRDSLLRHIAIVAQDPFLFNAPIRENIGYGRRGVTEEEIQEAAKAANIHDFIVSLEKGYDTVTGERGVMVSGGERQRLAIARAILKDADILLLDEATSSLDTESEQVVQRALNNLMQNKTTFIIAHRLSTVQHADRIVVLEDGRIVQVGSHAELLEQGGLYKKLYEMQFANGVPV
jgi:subfamily B ATP-binding cassette protein MsbA